MDRLLRNPDLLICWSGGELLAEDLRIGRNLVVSPETILLLDSFEGPRTPAAVANSLPDYDKKSVLKSVDKLRRLGLLIPEREGRRRLSRINAWKENLASARYHVASRDIPFVTSPAAVDHFLQARLAAERPPPRFKRYRGAKGRRLPAESTRENTTGLERALAARRTVRVFARAPVPFTDLAAVVRGTWGRTGWLDAGHLAQTFCLLATARGLGPFTTAAIQDSYIEKLIGLDGVKEFPVYLCGAGVPATPLRPSLPR